MKNRRLITYSIIGILLIVVIGTLGVSAYVGWSLTHPQRESLTSTPATYNLTYTEVSFKSRSGDVSLNGWLIPSPGSDRTVIMAHGYRKNREQNGDFLGLSQALNKEGYNVLLFDFRNSGKSGGDLTSVGYYETDDLLGAVDFVTNLGRPGENIAVLGFSMGGAAAIRAAEKEPKIQAVIADSSFADLTEYLEDNMSLWSGLPHVPFTQIIMKQIPMLTGLETNLVSPRNSIKEISPRPILLIHGDEDIDIPLSHSLELYEAYGNKGYIELWLVSNAAHVKAYQTDPKAYERKIIGFLSDVFKEN